MPGAAPAGVLGTTRSPRSATPGRQAEGRSGTSRESPPDQWTRRRSPRPRARRALRTDETTPVASRSEEHTSELQSQSNLVCRLLLEKKKYQTMPLDHQTTLLTETLVAVDVFSHDVRDAM